MSTVIHLFKRDVRRYWALSALSAACSLFGSFSSYLNLEFGMDHQLLAAVLLSAPVLLGFLLCSVVVQSDITVGDRGFWRTRPISPSAIFLSKALFMLAVVVAPLVASDLLLTRVMHAPWRLCAAVATESALLELAVCLAAMVVASATRTLLQALTASFVAFFVLMILMAEMNSFAEVHGFGTLWGADVSMHGPRVAAFELYLALVLLVVLGFQIHSRRPLHAVLMALLGVPLAMLGSGRWPVEFGSMEETHSLPKLECPGELQVRLEPPAEVGPADTIRDPESKRDVSARRISMALSLRNVPHGRIARLDAIASSLRLDDGRQVTMPTLTRENWPAWGWNHQLDSICAELGIPAPAPGRLSLDPAATRIQLLDVPIDAAAPFQEVRSTYTGVLKFSELAFRVATRLPVRYGASVTEPGQAWTFDGTTFANGVARLHLRYLFVTSGLVRGREAMPLARLKLTYGFVLLNRSRGEYALSMGGWGGWDTVFGPLSIIRENAMFHDRFSVEGGGLKGTVDAAWLQDAELLILECAPVGTFEKPVRLDGFVLPRVDAGVPAAVPAFWQ
jgi:hypothetical protein